MTAPPAQELHIALDGSGITQIACATHPARGGNMSQAMQTAANSANGCHIIHNHPSQSSLSPDDWDVLAAHPRLQMTAVNSEGTTFRGRMLNTACLQQDPTYFQSRWDYVAGEFEKQITLWFSSSSTFDLGNFGTHNGWLIGRAIGKRLQAIGYADFECLPDGDNVIALRSPHAPMIERTLMTLCAQRII
ncbi:hypothetical protein [Nitrospirillum amazonense]|nr:hypothetical protein [Nitrospirillum amazonense]